MINFLMRLSAKKVLELNERHNLIEGLCERELKNPEGVLLELRVGEVYDLVGDGFLGIDDRKTPEAILAHSIIGERVSIHPGKYKVVTTIEKINCPKEKIFTRENSEPFYIVPVIKPRTSLQRSGILLLASATNPGYSGKLTFGLANLGIGKFDFEIGARMFEIYFEEVYGEMGRAYEGQWSGGRVGTAALERQT
jgi:deoxycytidine triphosphate deaminase